MEIGIRVTGEYLRVCGINQNNGNSGVIDEDD